MSKLNLIPTKWTIFISILAIFTNLVVLGTASKYHKYSTNCSIQQITRKKGERHREGGRAADKRHDAYVGKSNYNYKKLYHWRRKHHAVNQAHEVMV